MPVLYVANLPKSWSVFVLLLPILIFFITTMSPPPCFPCPHPRVLLLPRFQFQELDILNMADELLSKGFVGLSQDGAKVAKIKVLDSARAFFEKTFSSDGYASPLLLPLSLTICTLSLRMCCFPFLV